MRMQASSTRKVMATILLFVATGANANADQVKYDSAEVIETTPIMKTVRVSMPHQECWDEEVSDEQPRRRNHLAPVMGGIFGGAIGNAVGHSNRNKQVGALVGAVLGATIGHAASLDTERRQFTGHRTEERCETKYEYREEDRLQGYLVRYRYAGQTYTARTDSDPGASIRVRVSVSPVL